MLRKKQLVSIICILALCNKREEFMIKIKLIVSILFIVQMITSSFVYAGDNFILPTEFFSCSEEKLELSELKYYTKRELTEGYCTCDSLMGPTRKHVSMIEGKRIDVSTMDEYSMEEYNEASKPLKMTDANMSRIARILKIDHNYIMDVSKCKK